jgi:hypothetical protein
VVVEVLQNNGRWKRCFFNLVNQGPYVRTLALEAFENISFVLDARMARYTFDDYAFFDIVPIEINS